MRPMDKAQLRGKLERLIEELRGHGGNGLSVYGRRLRSEIAAIQLELETSAFQQYPRYEQESGDRREHQQHGEAG